jgi:hypothetical protein
MLFGLLELDSEKCSPVRWVFSDLAHVDHGAELLDHYYRFGTVLLQTLAKADARQLRLA